MKLFNLFFFLFSALFLSCDNDETNLINDTENYLGKFVTDVESAGMDKLVKKLDLLTGDDADVLDMYNKSYDAIVDDKLVRVLLSLDTESNTCAQMFLSGVAIEQTRNDDNLSYASTEFLHRSYAYKLKPVAKNDESFMLERKYENGIWEDWHYAENPGFYSDNYGANIALFGGSYADYTRGGGVKNMPYSDGTYGLQDFIAEQLGCLRVDNYGQAGHGYYTGNKIYAWNHFPFNTYVQAREACNYSLSGDLKYDVFIFFGGINDFNTDIPLGSCLETENNETYCGGIKKAINVIRNSHPRAKIYMISAFKAFNLKDKNELGCSFDEYFRAYKSVAETEGIPFLDVCSIQNANSDNYQEYYFDKLHPDGYGYYDVAWEIVKFISTE